VVAAARRCTEKGLGFALVTPPVREAARADVEHLLATVALDAADSECVFNDWGMLHWAGAEQLPLRFTAGRMLSRQRRGPRVLAMAQHSSPDEVAILRGSAWEDPRNQELLAEMQVKRVELDFLLQGTRRPNLQPGIALSICAPWLPVSVPPSCAYTDDPAHCARQCLAHEGVRQVTEQDPHPLWIRGNALFVHSDLHPPYQAAATLGADRLVWSDTLPT
jgi:hypothetical protein